MDEKTKQEKFLKACKMYEEAHPEKFPKKEKVEEDFWEIMERVDKDHEDHE